MSPSIYFLLHYYNGYGILIKQADFILFYKKDGDFKI